MGVRAEWKGHAGAHRTRAKGKRENGVMLMYIIEWKGCPEVVQGLHVHNKVRVSDVHEALKITANQRQQKWGSGGALYRNII